MYLCVYILYGERERETLFDKMKKTQSGHLTRAACVTNLENRVYINFAGSCCPTFPCLKKDSTLGNSLSTPDISVLHPAFFVKEIIVC